MINGKTLILRFSSMGDVVMTIPRRAPGSRRGRASREDRENPAPAAHHEPRVGRPANILGRIAGDGVVGLEDAQDLLGSVGVAAHVVDAVEEA